MRNMSKGSEMRPSSDDAEAVAELNFRVPEYLISRVGGKYYLSSSGMASMGDTLCEAINQFLDRLDEAEA